MSNQAAFLFVGSQKRKSKSSLRKRKLLDILRRGKKEGNVFIAL